MSDPLYFTLTSEDNYVLEYLFDLIATFHPQDIQKYVAKYITYIPFREHLIAHEIGGGNYESALFKINDYLTTRIKTNYMYLDQMFIVLRYLMDAALFDKFIVDLIIKFPTKKSLEDYVRSLRFLN